MVLCWTWSHQVGYWVLCTSLLQRLWMILSRVCDCGCVGILPTALVHGSQGQTNNAGR